MRTNVQATSPAFNPAAAAQAPAAPRFDLYAAIHKAIRVASAELLGRLGAMDADDDAQVAPAIAGFVAFLEQLRAHVKHENRHVHPAMEARHPGSAGRVTEEHEQHLASIDALEAEARALAALPAAQRRLPALRLYRHFALFTAENFEHMHHEETVHNPVLWGAYSDAELLAIEQAIVASQTPEQLAGWMHWFAAALPTAELAPMLAGARAGMPAEAFEGLIGQIAGRQTAERHRRLLAALGDSAGREANRRPVREVQAVAA